MLVKWECPNCEHEQLDFVLKGDNEMCCEECGALYVAESVLSDTALEQLYMRD